jgi:hypothetical protein
LVRKKLQFISTQQQTSLSTRCATKGTTMTNVIAQSTTTANEAIVIAGEIAQSVVQHDTAAQAGAQFKSDIASIEQLVIERQVWENTVYRTSNDMLYGLLQKCYALYKRMEGMGAEAVTLRENLTSYINLKGIKCVKSSHTIVKIIKCVFGDDRRRASAYGIVLRAALAEKVLVEGIPTYIRTKGGVEEIRLAKSPNAMTAKEKASVAATAVKADSMGVFASTALGEKFDAGKTDATVVLIGTWQADGSVIVRSVVQSDTAVNAALATYYSSNKDAVKQQAEQQQAANDEQIKQDAVSAAAHAAVVNG